MVGLLSGVNLLFVFHSSIAKRTEEKGFEVFKGNLFSKIYGKKH